MMLPNTANIVILAANFNPSIISKDWLNQNNIFIEPLINFINTPVFSNSETHEFRMIVDENRLQLTLKRVSIDNMRTASDILARIVELLPHTPYKAVGYNLGYRFSKAECNTELLVSPNHKQIMKLTSKGYELGVNILFSFKKFIVTFSISPIAEQKSNRILNFNYHSSIGSSTEIINRLNMQGEVLQKTSSFVEALCQP